MQISEKDKEFLKTYNPDKYQHPSVTADILIFKPSDTEGWLEVLLIQRKRPPFQDCWAVPGGFVNIDESIDAAAARELKEETDIDADKIHMEQLYTFGTVGRDPRTRVISVAYMAMVPKNLIHAKAGDDASSAEWVKVKLSGDSVVFEDNRSLAFDHEEIVKTALSRMRGKINYVPIAFQFLDKNRFTIGELQKIYEAVLGKTLDASNFRRFFFANYIDKNLAVETGEKENNPANRPGRYFKYCG